MSRPVAFVLRAGACAALLASTQLAAVPVAWAAGGQAKYHLTTYSTEAAATTACASDAVVWHARHSKEFHLSTSRYYGKTKNGAYACEKDAVAVGLHASSD